MAKQTPEGKVKEEIDKYLKGIDGMFFRKPVVTAYGPRLIDYICCYKGRFIVIEAKKPGSKPTAQQIQLLVDVYNAGGIAIVADCVEDVDHAIDIALQQDIPWLDPSLHSWLDHE
jgi:hypothetical protein